MQITSISVVLNKTKKKNYFYFIELLLYTRVDIVKYQQNGTATPTSKLLKKIN